MKLLVSKMLAKRHYVYFTNTRYLANLASGEVSEWLMVPLSKSGLRFQWSVGSNPTLSALCQLKLRV